jgi:two-component system, NtrC family, sensor kinase
VRKPTLGWRRALATLALFLTAIIASAALAALLLPEPGLAVLIVAETGLGLVVLVPALILQARAARSTEPLEKRLEKETRARTVLHAITTIFNEKLGNAAAVALLELLRDEFHSPFAFLGRMDPDGGMSCLRSDDPEEKKRAAADIPKQWRDAMAAGQTSLVQEAGLALAEPHQRAALVPIVAATTVMGLFILPEPRRSFTPSDAELLGELGASLASALLSQRRRQEQEYRKLKIIEDAYRLTEARLRAVFDDSEDMILTADSEGRIIDINKAGVRLLGYDTEAAVIGHGEQEFWMNNRDHEILMREIAEHGHVKDFEVILKRADGATMFGLESAIAFCDPPGGKGEIHAMVKDITDRIHDEQAMWKMTIELAEANQRLKESQSLIVQQEKLASIGQLAAGVAHEINNPLAFLKSNATVVRRDIVALQEFLHVLEASPAGDEMRIAKKKNDIDAILRDLDAILAESEDGFRRITDIVQNLKSFSRIESSEQFEPFDITKGIETTVSVARNEIRLVADVKLDLAPLPLVECIGGQVNQVLLNIIVNAAQAIKSQGRTDRGTITIRTGVTEDWVWIDIKDDGPGVPKGLQLRIFDAFYTTKPIGQGTGLGLSISSDIIIQKHGGRLTLKDEPGTGACFRIELPVKHLEATTRPPEPLLPR